MRGILIINTGSPKTKERADVKDFISAMLSDPLVLTVPNWLRNILATKIIAPLRASNSASHYSLIWDNKHNASPLIYNTEQLANKIKESAGMPVEIAMRYISPTIEEAFENLIKKCPTLHEVVVVPMFPQYAQSSYQTVVDAVGRCFYNKPYPFRLKIIKPFYNKPEYINALAKSLSPHTEKGYDMLVFSFHSLPLSHVEIGWKKGNEFDYVYQVKETIKLVSKKLNLDTKKNRIVYSSAIGKKWLKPDLNKTMEELGADGIKKIIVITPGFPADNLETLFDIDIEAKKTFINAGGEDFTFVKGLNSEDFWVEELIQLITKEI